MTNQSIKQRIQEDMKSAMRSHDKERLATIRFILAAIKQKEVDERIELDGKQIISVIEKLIKQHQDAIAQYQTAQRQDLVQKEQAELEILQTYMPAPLSDAEVDKIIQATITKTNATSMRDMGSVMNELKESLQGRTDMSNVSKKVKAILASS